MSVYVELDVRGRWALSVLTEKWSDEEKQALRDGDEEARQALIDAAVARVLNDPDEAETEYVEVNIP